MFGKGKVEEGSEPDFMGPRFMGHPGFLKPFRALNASPLELCLKSQQAEDARGVCVCSTPAGSFSNSTGRPREVQLITPGEWIEV